MKIGPALDIIGNELYEGDHVAFIRTMNQFNLGSMATGTIIGVELNDFLVNNGVLEDIHFLIVEQDDVYVIHKLKSTECSKLNPETYTIYKLKAGIE